MVRIVGFRHQVRGHAKTLHGLGGLWTDGRQSQPGKGPGIPARGTQTPEENLRSGGAGKHQTAVAGEVLHGFLQLRVFLPGHGADAGIVHHLRPQLPEPLGQGSAAVLRPGDHHGLSLHGKTVKPVKPGRQGADLAHHNDGGTLHPGLFRLRRQFLQGGNQLPLPGQRAPLHNRGRHIRSHSGIQQSPADSGQAAHAHQEHQGSPGAPQGLKIDVQLRPRPGMARDDVDGGAEIPVGHRNARIGGYGQGGGNPRHHLEGDARRFQQLQLFPAPAKEEGIAALEPHHPLVLLGLAQKNPVDLLLGHQMVAGFLAHVDFFRVPGDERQNGGAHQPVIYHHLGIFNGLTALLGQKTRISRACPHQNHAAHLILLSAAAPDPRPAFPRLSFLPGGYPGAQRFHPGSHTVR